MSAALLLGLALAAPHPAQTSATLDPDDPRILYLTLWRQGPDAAAAFATRLVARLESAGVPPARWLELRGDALFEAGESVAARESYEAALEGLPDPAPIWAKLSDVHFVLGDLDGERGYRECVHGSLRH